MEQGRYMSCLDVVLDGGWVVGMMKNTTQLCKTNDDFKFTLNNGGELICILKKFYKPFKLLCTVYPTNNTETRWQVAKAMPKLGRYKGLN